ncbi:MAG: PilZ domain-containing protein [Candidatus Binatia bacterium]|nr:PilZ domain-containing protein [Candidatus Binatia bacterium]
MLEFSEMSSTRYYQRLRLSFPVRFRPAGTAEPWQDGTGIDIGIGGFACFLPVLPPPTPGTMYDVELMLHFADCSREPLRFHAEVRWSAAATTGSRVGLQVSDSHARARLARALLPL